MMLNNIFIKIEKFMCLYLGLSGCEADRPQVIRLIKNNIFIVKNHPMQRHKSQVSWDNFIKNGLSETDEIGKIKVGKAAGKAIAKNLTISFENVEIKNINENEK